MRMKNILSIVLVMVLLASAVPLAVMPAAAAGIPGDTDGNDELTENELANTILSYILEEGHLELEDLRDAAHIYAYWDGKPRTIVDTADRTVTIYRPIKRIITLTSDSAEGVRILGEVDNIVGVTDTIKVDGKEYFPELEDIPSVGTWKEFDYEKIVEIAEDETDIIVPDIIVISYVYKVLGVEEGLSSFENIAVVGLDLYKSGTLEDEIIKLGYIIEREGKAQDFIDWSHEKEDTVRSVVDELEKPKVYIEKGISTGTGELGTYGKGSALDELCKIAGGDNIAKDIEEKYPKVDWEWVISPDQNPDIIVKSEPKTFLELTNEAEAMREEVMNRPDAGNVSAIKNGSVYIHIHKITYGLESIVGLTYWAKIFHPDTSLDPEAVYREYLVFQGLEYSEDKMVVYPEVI